MPTLDKAADGHFGKTFVVAAFRPENLELIPGIDGIAKSGQNVFPKILFRYHRDV